MKKMKRTAALLLSLLMLLSSALALSPTVKPQKAQQQGAAPTVKVYLKSLGLRDSADLTLDGRYSVVTAQGAELLFDRGSTVSIRLRDDSLWLFAKGVSLSLGKHVTFTRTASDTLEKDGIRFISGGNLYPGTLRLEVREGVIRPILTISVEDYLLGVVPYEMSNSFPLQALKAQAVCARTYALSHVNGNDEYDLVDNTNDQVFRGIYFGNTNVIKAVQETAGVVGAYQGKLATCYYSASNGGQTELPENVWSVRGKLGYYSQVSDPYDLENPQSVVKTAHLRKDGRNLPEEFVTLLHAQLTQEISRQGFDADSTHFRVNRIESITLGGQTLGKDSTYVTTMTITFRWAGQRVMRESVGDEEEFDLAQLLDHATPAPTALPGASPTPRLSGFIEAESAATLTLPLFPDVAQIFSLLISGTSNERITVSETDSEFLLQGRRFGHGVGMSQRGAQWMAGKYGKTYVEILNFYYPGMELMHVSAGAQQAPTARPQLAYTPGPSASPTPRPTLMPVSSITEGSWLASVEGIDDDSSLNLRAEPQSGADILMRMFKHQQLEVLELSEDGVWAHVRTDSIEGWCMITFLKRMDTPAVTPSPTPSAGTGTVLLVPAGK